jgi:hypothetical protein
MSKDALSGDLKELFLRHTELNSRKVVSYLPCNTIQNVIGITLEVYASEIEKNGGSYLIFDENECCIYSGAIYAFLPEPLGRILEQNKDILLSLNISAEPTEFVREIAGTWFDHDASIMPIIKQVFGAC